MKSLKTAIAGLLLAAVAASPASAASDATAASASAAPAGWQKLLTPAELAALRDSAQPRIVDIRGGTTADGTPVYAAGHVPGAVTAPYGTWRGPKSNPGQLRSEAEFGALLRSLGITAETPVVVVSSGRDATDFGAAARVYWTLKSLGVSHLAILNGGHKAWVKAGLPVSTDAVEVAASTYRPQFNDRWRASRDDVAAAIAEVDGVQLVDARPESFFRGKAWHPAAEKPGTLEGAKNVAFTRWFERDSGAILDPARVAAAARQADLGGAPLTVSFCNTGHWAATNWFAISELADIDNTKLYAESMVDWSKSGQPMANVPGRLEWYWLATKKWFQSVL